MHQDAPHQEVVLGPVVTRVADGDQFSGNVVEHDRVRGTEKRVAGNTEIYSEEMGRDGVDVIEDDERWEEKGDVNDSLSRKLLCSIPCVGEINTARDALVLGRESDRGGLGELAGQGRWCPWAAAADGARWSGIHGASVAGLVGAWRAQA
jgi:hypothetical protein